MYHWHILGILYCVHILTKRGCTQSRSGTRRCSRVQLRRACSHAEVSGNTATYASLARLLGPNIGGQLPLVEKNLIRVAKLYITTSTRGSRWPLLPDEGVPSHADEMRRRTVGVSKSSISPVTGWGQGIIITRYR